jgi:hypothetical protein
MQQTLYEVNSRIEINKRMLLNLFLSSDRLSVETVSLRLSHVAQPVPNESNFFTSIPPFISLILILRIASELVHILCPCSRTRYRENNGSDIGSTLTGLQGCRSPSPESRRPPPRQYECRTATVKTTEAVFNFRIFFLSKNVNETRNFEVLHLKFSRKVTKGKVAIMPWWSKWSRSELHAFVTSALVGRERQLQFPAALVSQMGLSPVCRWWRNNMTLNAYSVHLVGAFCEKKVR